MLLSRQVKAARTLLSLAPAHSADTALRALVKLRGGDPTSEGAFIEEILRHSNTRLAKVRCGSGCCGASFLATEFNRTGDAYRCPWCNHFTSRDGDVSASETSKALRRLEKRLLERMLEYAALYYGESAMTNCFVWEIDEEILGFAIMFSKEDSSDDADDALLGRRQPTRTWNSVHVFCSRPTDDRRFEYVGVSSLFVDVNVAPCRFSGLIKRKKSTFAGPSSADGLCHIASIGHHIQRLENALRDDVSAVQFGKGGQVIGTLRKTSNAKEAPRIQRTLQAAHADETIAAEVDPQTRPVEAKPEVPVVKPIWYEAWNATEQCYWYYAADGDETSWEKPNECEVEIRPAPEEAEVAAAADPDPVAEVAADSAGGEAADASYWESLAQVLDALELSVAVDDYVAMLAAADVHSIDDFLQCDDAYLKAAGVVVKGDRKKMNAWIATTWEEGQGGDE